MRRTSGTLGVLGSCIGKGIIAGLAGTAAMSISHMMDIKKPTQEKIAEEAVETADEKMDVDAENPETKRQAITLVHWGYGATWGLVRGLACFAGIKGAPASLLHFAAMWGTELWMSPKLTGMPPASERSKTDLGIDATHHAVYAAAAGAVFEYMDKRF